MLLSKHAKTIGLLIVCSPNMSAMLNVFQIEALVINSLFNAVTLYRVCQKKYDPFSFKILQEIIRF